MKILILYSGGLDSVIMYQYAKAKYPDAEIHRVYYDMDHSYNYKEISALDDDVEYRHLQLDSAISPVGKEGSNSGNIIIPGRNLLLAVTAACQFIPDEIWMGALMGEIHKGSTDKNEEFRSRLNSVLSYVFSPFHTIPQVIFPFVRDDMGKLEIVEWALNNGMSREQLISSSSCLSEEKGRCGVCVVCARRWGIFTQLGFSETYNQHPVYGKDAPIEIYIEMLKGEADPSYNCHYDHYRRNEIVPAIYKLFQSNDPKVCLSVMSNM